MADKAYIVANQEQELQVLTELENEGYTWNNLSSSKALEITHKDIDTGSLSKFPYVLFANDNTNKLTWNIIGSQISHEIVYDGRKGTKMKISKEVYDALVEWKKRRHPVNNAVNSFDLMELSRKDEKWWQGIDTTKITNTNNWLITLIRWASGEDVFEVEKPKKWVVRSKEKNNYGDYLYATLNHDDSLTDVINCYGANYATKFDTKEEAVSWANSHQEVIEVEG